MWTSRSLARSSGTHASYPVFLHRLAPLRHASFRPRLGARCIWMQEGVDDAAAARRAEAAGVSVVENRCILKYHRRLMD